MWAVTTASQLTVRKKNVEKLELVLIPGFPEKKVRSSMQSTDEQRMCYELTRLYCGIDQKENTTIYPQRKLLRNRFNLFITALLKRYVACIRSLSEHKKAKIDDICLYSRRLPLHRFSLVFICLFFVFYTTVYRAPRFWIHKSGRYKPW